MEHPKSSLIPMLSFEGWLCFVEPFEFVGLQHKIEYFMYSLLPDGRKLYAWFKTNSEPRKLYSWRMTTWWSWYLWSIYLIYANVIHQQPASKVLKEIQVFLEANPSEIITIMIEDYVSSPKGLTKVFDAAGLRKYWFPVSRMPKNGENWPTVDDMVQRNQRLVVFTSKSAKEASEGIAYEWRYLVENQCEFCLCPVWKFEAHSKNK